MITLYIRVNNIEIIMLISSKSNTINKQIDKNTSNNMVAIIII